MSRYFEVYATGLVYASVCTDMSPKAAAARLNREYPTGITSKWKPSKDRTFHSGEPNPHSCERNPGSTHWLFSC